MAARFAPPAKGQVEFTLEVEDAEGLRTYTRVLQTVSGLELRAFMEASGFRVRRSGKMLGRVVISGVAD